MYVYTRGNHKCGAPPLWYGKKELQEGTGEGGKKNCFKLLVLCPACPELDRHPPALCPVCSGLD